MLDKTTTNNNTTVKSSPSGLLQRTHEDSYILRMHHNSPLAKEQVFVKYPEIEGKRIVILQVMNIADGYLLLEIINKEDE